MKKTNNKGFSLVELIIVIAIMVILVAVIAPQYLKFVNNSKVSTDVQTAADMATAINVDIANSDATSPFTAADTLAPGNVDNLGAWPMSKYAGTASDIWKVYGNNVDGVKKITIKATDKDGNANVEMQAYPNPDDATDGFNTKCKK